MHVSANIIRFPAPAAVAVRTAETTPEQPPADIVAFSPAAEDDGFSTQSQQHGQWFAAHRIVSRVADQLDSLAPL